MIEEILDGMVKDMKGGGEHLSDENIRVYFALIDQFEAKGQDLSHYREIGERTGSKPLQRNWRRNAQKAYGKRHPFP
jgi:hypothetical protein